ncbi:MAG: hypothetical protein CMN78_05095 [Spirochaetales bacterium]|nr:hypothetical protein [Spirochaetales bacterium]
MIKTIQPICEYEKNPIGIDVIQPRFSWQLESGKRGDSQSAYRILVASKLELLQQNTGDKWDTGKVDKPDTVNVSYGGTGLESGERCFWKVISWDGCGSPGDWTEPSTFEMGLMEGTDWEGSWIGADAAISSPLFRREFDIEGEVERARLYICGIGWHEARLNGSKIGDHEFDPAPTWYDNIFSFETKSRVLYVTHDVTRMLRPGKNAIGVILGHGWYSSDTASPPGRAPSGDRPLLIAQLNVDLRDGRRVSLATDEEWQTQPGPITANDMFGGESYDARLEQGGWDSPKFVSAWGNAQAAQSPSGRLVSQSVEPERVTKRFKATRKLQSGENSWIMDFGQFISGWAELTVAGQRGTCVDIRYAGRVNYETTSLDFRNTDYGNVAHQKLNLGAQFADSYILSGNGTETWHPRFTVHGFRYVEVTGYPGEPALDAVVGCAVNSDIKPVGEFSCSNELFNKIHHNVWWTFLGSYQGIPQDAADRAERCGWLGDPGFVAEDYMYNFRDIRFWSKWLEDIADTQQADGSVSYVAPPNWGEGSFRVWPCWECAYTLFVWYCYNFYDDKRVLEVHYDGIKSQVEYFRSLADGLILDDALGDHMEPSFALFSNPSPQDTPPDLCATAYFYYCSWILARMAGLTGHDDDAHEYGALAESIKKAFIEKFFDPETNQISTGSQTSNALALYLGLVPDERKDLVLDNLASEIIDNRHGHLKTGIIGTDALEQTLPKYGRSDIMYGIASKTTFPSWGYGVVNGQTTIAEEFGCTHHYSVSMKMHGSVEKFFYKDVAGISPASPGFRTIEIHPKLVKELSSAKASIESIRGTVAIEWLSEKNRFEMKVNVPVGVSANVKIPALDLENVVITERGATVWKDGVFVQGVTGLFEGTMTDDSLASFLLESGSYEFEVSGSDAEAQVEK